MEETPWGENCTSMPCLSAVQNSGNWTISGSRAWTPLAENPLHTVLRFSTLQTQRILSRFLHVTQYSTYNIRSVQTTAQNQSQKRHYTNSNILAYLDTHIHTHKGFFLWGDLKFAERIEELSSIEQKRCLEECHSCSFPQNESVWGTRAVMTALWGIDWHVSFYWLKNITVCCYCMEKRSLGCYMHLLLCSTE